MQSSKLILFAAVAISAIAGVGAASAADLPARTYTKAAVAVPEVFSWTGFYIGVNGGYGWGQDPVSFGPANAAADIYFTAGALPRAINTSPAGGLAGGQIGYNWQWTPSWVVGVEADLDWANINGAGSVNTLAGGFDPLSTSAQQKLTALGTLRGRIGYTFDRVLFYGTGGLAYGRTTLNTSIIDTFAGRLCGPGGICAAASSSQWQYGWTAGGGVEWAFAPQWSFKGEYLHYDLGSRSQNQFDPLDVAPAPVFNSAATFRGDIVRAGINYRFR